MSTSEPKYPLEQVLDVKKDRVEKAEKVVKEKKRALEIENDKLKKLEKERDEVLSHHNDKLSQLRKALDEGTTSDEVILMKSYLKVVKEQLEREEGKVKEQKKQVKAAQELLEEAKRALHRRRIELEKIQMHKELWLKEENIEILKRDAKEHDEVGTAMHQAKKRKFKKVD